MERDELAFAGVARQAELIRAGDVSSRELVELYLERIERLDPELNAFRKVMAERALVDAGCPIALSSDAHVPDQLGYEYERAAELLDAAGVREIAVFERRERRLEPIG